MGNENTEVSQLDGAGGSPSQSASSSQTQPFPVDVKALEAALSKIPWLEGEINALKSNKDKGVAKVSTELKNLQEQFKRYEQLKARGLDQDEIERQFELDAILAERRSGSSSTDVSPVGGGGTPTQAAGVDTAALVKLAGLDANSPEVVAAIRDHSDDALAFMAALTDLGQKRRAAQQAPPNAAQIMSGGGGGSVPNDIEAKTARLATLLKDPTKNRLEIEKLQPELEKLIKASH